VRRFVSPEAHREFASSIKSAGEPFCPQTDTFSADGARLATSAYDGTVRMWNAQSAALEREIRICPRGGVINALACTLDSTPDGRHVATANSNGALYLLRLASPAH
jgi:WD40 repeat protein